MNPPIAVSVFPARWMTFARILQAVIICITIGLFIVSLPINYELRSAICREESCPPGQVTLTGEAALNRIGMSMASFVTLTIALDILIAVTFTTCAVVIFVRKPNDILTIFVTIMLVTFGAATFTGAIRGIAIAYPWLDWLPRAIALLGNCSMLAFFFIFPNGRFVPRWSVFVLAAYALVQVPRLYFPSSSLNLQVINLPLYNLIFVGANLCGVAAQIYRYWRVSDIIEKQQTKWVVYGLSLAVGGYMTLQGISYTLPDPMGRSLPTALTLSIFAILFILLLPLSISIAVIRYRLWDINPIINRTLVYGALSASTIALYIVAVGLASKYFQQANLIVSFLATGVIAILFEPLRERLQRGVNRLMYGERDDPATVLMRLSQRLDSALAPESVLQTIVETLAQTLRLPYAAISLLEDAQEPRFASHRDLPPSELIQLPLTYQTERVGTLTLAPRAEGESFAPNDLNLLNIIAGQAGIAVHNLRLTKDLQRSREKLVAAQEEERRRLRRDLHDGIGPTLASFSQRLDAAADLVNDNPQASVELLRNLKGQVKGTVAEIRRLVYALRPPVLDEFGLVSAIREHVAQYTGPNGLQTTFDVTEPLPPLPAAVEVAAYRIALEAFTNIINHAEANACHIKITIEDRQLVLEIADNGRGFSANSHAGVGLASMRERANELGGEFAVEAIPTGGTIVRAKLPIAKI